MIAIGAIFRRYAPVYIYILVHGLGYKKSSKSKDVMICMNGWRIHFGQLAKKSTTEKFDNDYLKLMEQEIDVILQICQDQVVHKEVCNEELLKAVRKLNTNKAADYFFGITAETVINDFLYRSEFFCRTEFNITLYDKN